VQALAKRRLARAGVLPVLARFAASQPAVAFAPDYCDLLFLYRSARQRKPKAVLEFGSGCSTVVLAHALWRNAADGSPGHLYSVDANQFWADATSKALPQHVSGLCSVMYSPVVETERFGVLGFSHERVPDIAPDFVYIDGPSLTPSRAAAFDVFDLEPKFQPGCVVIVDGRPLQARLLREHLQKTYVASERKSYFSYVFELTPPPHAMKSSARR
jgi:hypothetical protein